MIALHSATQKNLYVAYHTLMIWYKGARDNQVSPTHLVQATKILQEKFSLVHKSDKVASQIHAEIFFLALELEDIFNPAQCREEMLQLLRRGKNMATRWHRLIPSNKVAEWLELLKKAQKMLLARKYKVFEVNEVCQYIIGCFNR